MSVNTYDRGEQHQVSSNPQGSSDNALIKERAYDANSNASTKSKNSTRKRRVNPFYAVVSLFKKIFGSFDEADQDTANKRAALNLALGLRKKYYPDKLRFWQDLLDESKIILDSVRFNEACKKMELNPQAVAEHLVCEGKAVWMKVLKDGLESYGEKVYIFKERLYVDKYKLYAKPETEDNKSEVKTDDSSSDVA
jgi:hypothetical protein